MNEQSRTQRNGSDPPTFLIRNQKPSRLEICGQQHTLKLAPLQQIRVYYRPRNYLGDAAEHALTDRAIAWECEPVRSTRVWATAWLTLIGLLSLAVAVAFSSLHPPRWGVAGTAVVLAALCWFIAFALNRYGPGPDEEPATGEISHRLTGWQFTKDVAVTMLQKLALLVVLAVGILAPTAAIYYGTELSQIVVVTRGPHIEVNADESAYPLIVARSLQIVLIVILALIPGLMYFQFDREKLDTLIDRWMHHAFRLDPTLHTISDIDAKYGRRVEEFYGATFASGVTTGKKRLTTRSPLYVATLLLAIGWIMVLLNATVDLTTRNGTAAASLTDQPVQQFIQPAFTPMTCAFLGSYFFALHVVLLGYVRGDLRPKTYNVVAVRILVAVILAWMLQALVGDNEWVLAVSFLAGIVPDTVLRYIRDIPTRLSHGGGTPRTSTGDSDPETIDEFDDRSPLLALDGIGIYERTRLAEEGITSIQALARHDLVDLMLSSRIPASRLIDWVDQALLYQHITLEDRLRLRRVGIRTATELLSANRASVVREHLVKALSDGEGRLPVILQALRGDEWLTYVTNWRMHDDTREPGRTVYTDAGLQLSTRVRGNGSRTNGSADLGGAGASDLSSTFQPAVEEVAPG